MVTSQDNKLLSSKTKNNVTVDYDYENVMKSLDKFISNKYNKNTKKFISNNFFNKLINRSNLNDNNSRNDK